GRMSRSHGPRSLLPRGLGVPFAPYVPPAFAGIERKPRAFLRKLSARVWTACARDCYLPASWPSDGPDGTSEAFRDQVYSPWRRSSCDATEHPGGSGIDT